MSDDANCVCYEQYSTANSNETMNEKQFSKILFNWNLSRVQFLDLLNWTQTNNNIHNHTCLGGTILDLNACEVTKTRPVFT